MTTLSPEELLKEQVHEALKKKKIKLWLGPFVSSPQEDCCDTALEALVEEWSSDQSLPAELRADTNSALLLQTLREFQTHSLAKYRENQKQKQQEPSPVLQSPISVVTANTAVIPAKISLQIKLLGLENLTRGISPDSGFAEGIEFIDKKESATARSTKPSVVLRLEKVSTGRTVPALVSFLQEILDVSQVRLIYRGKSIASSVSTVEEANSGPHGDEKGSTLGQVLLDAQSGTAPLSKEVFILCIASSSPPSEDPRMATHRDLHARIAAIRDAALEIKDMTNVEITDAHGTSVPMAKEDRIAFLTALALHRLGRNCVEAKDAIVFFLEADAEWNSHPNLRAWAERVDNYGLLQLDIAWSYLQLKSLSNLPDSLRRLEEAERVLRKQVNVNFITLALTQADLGNFMEVILLFWYAVKPNQTFLYTHVFTIF
jgi:hypothetical protein